MQSQGGAYPHRSEGAGVVMNLPQNQRSSSAARLAKWHGFYAARASGYLRQAQRAESEATRAMYMETARDYGRWAREAYADWQDCESYTSAVAAQGGLT